ncbi:MAG: hypothetical protein IPK80_34220 [Nannocystis sp.]|nr:hypothetical protein [Nannocystis sp.]
MNASDYFRALRSRAVTIVVDDPADAAIWSELGDVRTLAEHDLLAEHDRPALVVASRLATTGQLYDAWEDAPGEFTVLWAARYDAGSAAQRHAAALLRGCDGPGALARRAARYDELLTSSGCEVRTAAGALAVTLGDELEIANMSDEIRPRWLQATTEFLEASIVNLERDGSSFITRGVFAFDGLAWLVNTADARATHGDALDRLMRAAASGRTNLLEVADNRVVRAIVGGVDTTATLAALFADDARGPSVLELGFGCAALAPAWTLDSPLHKCSAGAFLGIGTGHRGPHVDFVAVDADVRFTAHAPA